MVKISRLLTVLVLLQGMGVSATKSTSVGLMVSIRPAVVLTVQGTQAIGITIRLAAQTQAKLWRSDECFVIPATAYAIPESGVYSVALMEINGKGSKLCLVSSDGALSVSVPLPVDSCDAQQSTKGTTSCP